MIHPDNQAFVKKMEGKNMYFLFSTEFSKFSFKIDQEAEKISFDFHDDCEFLDIDGERIYPSEFNPLKIHSTGMSIGKTILCIQNLENTIFSLYYDILGV